MDSVKAKTPAKTPKSAKKAAKTPMADTPRPVLSAKKQNGIKSAGKPTPNKKGNAKTPKSEPKKKGKTPVKKVEEEEEDDDEEDDDSEIEFNPELMKKLAEMASDDDEEDDDEEDMDEDDDEDDDEEEDDDDDDDDEDEEGEELMDEEQLKMLIKSLKDKKKKPEKNGVKETPAKKGKEPVKNGKKEKAAEKATPKEEVAAPAQTEATEATKEQHQKTALERDAKTLFVKGLPVNTQEDALKKLSDDIVAVRMRKRIRRDPKKTVIYAFVEFTSEETAEKNFKTLSETKLEGKEIFVDYMGKKSAHKSGKASVVRDVDPKKLYITGFPNETTELEMKQLFPKASEVILLTRGTAKKSLGFAFAKFDDAEVCADEMKRVADKEFKGNKLVVVYANLITDAQLEARKRKRKGGNKAEAKKAKVAKKVEEDDDDDEEDDDDDDDDDEEEE